MKAVVWLVATLACSVAAADPFVTMDRQSTGSELGFEGSYASSTGLGGDLLRFDLHGQAMDHRGFGFYGTLPFATLSGGGDSATAVGDVELGGIYATRRRSLLLVLHAGLTVPTGTSSQDYAVDRAAAGARIADLYLSLPHATSLRFGASPIVRSGYVILRADVGLDVNLDHDDRLPVDTVLRIDGAIGVDLGPAILAAELANTFDSGRDVGWIDTVAIALRFKARRVHPYTALVFALDHDARELMHVAFTFGFDFPQR